MKLPTRPLYRLAQATAAAALAAVLAACGGGGGNTTDPPPAAATYDIPTAPIELRAVGAGADQTGLSVLSLQRVSATPVSGTLVDYAFSLVVKNGPTALAQASVEVLGAGTGTLLIQPVVAVGSVAPNAQWSPPDRITLRHDTRQMFDAAALQWRVSPAPALFTTPAALAELGVSAVNYADGEATLYLGAGGATARRVSLALNAGLNESDFRISVLSPAAAGFTMSGDTVGSQLVAAAAQQVAGDVLQGQLQVTRLSTRQHAVVPLRAEVRAVEQASTGTITSQGGAITTKLGTITVAANNLAQSVSATARLVLLPSGARQMDIAFDRDVSASNLTIKLPTQPEDGELLAGLGTASTSTARPGTAKTRAGSKRSLEALRDTADCTQVRDGTYLNQADEAASTGDTLGLLVMKRDAPFVGSTRVSSALEIQSRLGQLITVTWRPASVLQAALAQDSTCAQRSVETVLSRVDWSLYEPVLFVHGFKLSGFGGGDGTWRRFPALAARTGVGTDPLSRKKLLPFEFRWDTDADIKAVASDLGRAINYINRRTSQRVHVVAHSFGGVVVRTLLQELAPDVADSTLGNMAQARAAVADVTSLGAPYNGILPKDGGVDTPLASVELPKGRDDDTFIGVCMQISCHQMGESSIQVTQIASALGYTAADLKPGGLAVELASTADRLPAIPIAVGIGLRITAGVYENGDRLISYAGQRFNNPRTAAAANSMALLTGARVGQATVTESVLGAGPSARPGVAATPNMISRRAGGYKHTLGTDGGVFGFGLEAAVDADCEIPETCTHAGYLLFRQNMGHALNLALQAATGLATAEPVALALNPVKLRGLAAAQKASLANLLTDVAPYVSGPRVRWDRMPAATLAQHNATLSRIFGDQQVAPVMADFAQRLAAFNDFAERSLVDQNTLLVWDAQTMDSLWSIAGAAAKGAFAAVKLMEPGASTIIALGGKAKFADPLRYVETLATLKQISGHVEFAQLVGECGKTTLELMTATLEQGGASDIDAKALQELLFEVVSCVSTGLSDDSLDGSAKFKLIMKLAASGVKVDGKTVNFWVAFSGALSAVLDVVPPSSLVTFGQGLVDYINAMATSWAAGQAIAERAGEVVSLRQDQVQALINQLREPLLADRALQIMVVRSADLFIAQPAQWATVQGEPNPAVLGLASSWTVADAFESVASVVWRFGNAVAEFVAQVVGGVSTAVSYVFNTLGISPVVATFQDAAQRVLGTLTTQVQVVAAQTVSDVQPRSAVAGSPRTFTVVGTGLPAGLKFQLPECGPVVEVPGGTATRREFTCTFPPETAAGSYEGAVALSESPFGAPPLYTFSVAVGRPGVATVQPASATRTLATLYEITGQDLPTTGITVVPVGDSRGSCQAPNNPRATGFGVPCELFKVGAQVLEVRVGTAVLGSVTVNVASNVTGVTWTSPSTSNSGTVKFGETVTFTVAGTNLLADPKPMGFAVEKCGVSNTELPGGTNEARFFSCLFNNEAGAVAGQMPGVVKDAPEGQVLFDGWKVPVEVPVVTNPEEIRLNEADQAGWRTRLTIKSTGVQGQVGLYEFAGLSCGGTLTYRGRTPASGYLFRERLTYGNCVDACDIEVDAGLTALREVCTPVVRPGEERWRPLSPHAFTPAQLEALVQKLHSPNGVVPIATDTLEGAFSAAPAPRAPWTFGWQATLGAAPTPYGKFSPVGTLTQYPTLATWNKGDGAAAANVYPYVYKNLGASNVVYRADVTPFPAQSLIVTPGSAGERALFRWTAPAAGAYEVKAGFELMQGGSVDVRVQKNGVDLFVQQLAGRGSAASAPLQTINLAAGDVIDFAVGNGGNNNESDITRVSASVSTAATPSPPALSIGDTMIASWHDTAAAPTYGAETYLYTCGAGWGGTGQALLRFDHGQVPSAARTVYLNLYAISGDDINGIGTTMEVVRVNGNWSEATTQWISRPSLAEIHGTFATPNGQYGRWVRVPITSLVKAWQNGTYANQGLAVWGVTNPFAPCRMYASREAPGNEPYLSWE